MVILHSYVSLPEGRYCLIQIIAMNFMACEHCERLYRNVQTGDLSICSMVSWRFPNFFSYFPLNKPSINRGTPGVPPKAMKNLRSQLGDGHGFLLSVIALTQLSDVSFDDSGSCHSVSKNQGFIHWKIMGKMRMNEACYPLAIHGYSIFGQSRRLDKDWWSNLWWTFCLAWRTTGWAVLSLRKPAATQLCRLWSTMKDINFHI